MQLPLPVHGAFSGSCGPLVWRSRPGGPLGSRCEIAHPVVLVGEHPAENHSTAGRSPMVVARNPTPTTGMPVPR